MTELQSLLIGLRNHWPDDARRLVLADWLEEHADSRAEAVRDFDKRLADFEPGEMVCVSAQGLATHQEIGLLAIGVVMHVVELKNPSPPEEALVQDRYANIYSARKGPAGSKEFFAMFPEMPRNPKADISPQFIIR